MNWIRDLTSATQLCTKEIISIIEKLKKNSFAMVKTKNNHNSSTELYK